MQKYGNARMPSLKDKLYGQPEPVKVKGKKAKVELVEKKKK